MGTNQLNCVFKWGWTVAKQRIQGKVLQGEGTAYAKSTVRWNSAGSGEAGRSSRK